MLAEAATKQKAVTAPKTITMEKTVTITEREYNSLKAAAELVRHPDVLEFTLQALRSEGKVALEDGFAE
jgi:hypothetical protein